MSLTSFHRLLPACAIAAMLASGASASAAQLRSGYAADVTKRSDIRDLGRARTTLPVSIAVTLDYRHESELETLTKLQGDVRSPLYHHFLTTAQFNAYFAPTLQDYARTISALERAGFRINATFANRTVIDAVAPANVAEKYFKTEIHLVAQAGHGLRYANARPAVMPAELRGVVGSVSGLSNLIVAKPALAFPSAANRAAQVRLATLRRLDSERPMPARNVGPRHVRGARFEIPRANRFAPARNSIRIAATNVLQDPGFESGGTTFWPQCGNVAATISSYRAHSGIYSERAGSTTSTSGEINGDAGLCQSVTIPASGKLSFYTYQFSNEADTTYSYQWVLLLDASGSIVAQLSKSVGNTNGWALRSYDLSAYAGRTLQLYFGVHGDGYSGAYTIQYIDDVSLTSGSTATPTPTPTGTPIPPVRRPPRPRQLPPPHRRPHRRPPVAVGRPSVEPSTARMPDSGRSPSRTDSICPCNMGITVRVMPPGSPSRAITPIKISARISLTSALPVRGRRRRESPSMAERLMTPRSYLRIHRSKPRSTSRPSSA